MPTPLWEVLSMQVAGPSKLSQQVHGLKLHLRSQVAYAMQRLLCLSQTNIHV